MRSISKEFEDGRKLIPAELFPLIIKKAESWARDFDLDVRPDGMGLSVTKGGKRMRIKMIDDAIDIECTVGGILKIHSVNPHTMEVFEERFLKFFE